MFHFIRRLLGMGGTAPDKAEAAVRDAAREPFLDAQDRDAAAALAAAGYAATPGPSDPVTGASAEKGTGKPETSPRKPYTPARGEYDRPAPEPTRTQRPPAQAQAQPQAQPLRKPPQTG